MTDEEVVERAVKRKKKKKPVIPRKDFLSSGSTLLNLAVSGRTYGCFAKGYFYWFVGDSQSGKSWLALSCFAEACINPEFDDYRIIYDGSEYGALMDIEKFFGPRVAQRIEPPKGTKEEPEYSLLSEDFYFNVDDAVESGKPFIYVMDSIDALDTKESMKKFKELKAARQGNRKVKGDYGMQKAKVNSAFLRRIVRGCRDTKSIVIVISQQRDNTGFGSQFTPNRPSGGRALKFYATVEIWTSIRGSIKKLVRGKNRKLGIYSKIQTKKNRVMGQDRSVIVPIYNSVGIDDLGSCIDFLISEKHWKGTENRVVAPEFDFKGDKEDLIHKIEENNEEAELRTLTKEIWDSIERESRVTRKNKYADI